MTDTAVLAEDKRQFDYVIEGPRNSQLWAERYLLYLEGVTAVFDGFRALDIDDLGVGHNELRVVVGPNGAGKTTMCDVVTGMTRPATGKVYFDGNVITDLAETTIAQRGIGRKFQIPNVFDSLTAWENMLLALPVSQRDRRDIVRRLNRIDPRLSGPAGIAAVRAWELVRNAGGRLDAQSRQRIEAILERVRLIDDRHTPAKNLSHGQRQWLAISALIIADPKLLLVDEPAAGLTDSETALTAELLLELKSDHTLIVIEHDMEFVRLLGARVTVLNEGRILAEGSMEEIQANKEVIEAYLGR